MTTSQGNGHEPESGPVVRPYALTGGRTKPTGQTIDLVALVSASRGTTGDSRGLEPEHRKLVRLARLPISVADLASGLDLPLGVVRILLADLRDRGLILIHSPASPGMADIRILREVVNGLRKI